MLPKVHRLPLRREDSFFANARKVFLPFGMLFVKQHSDELVLPNRAAVIVPKKSFPKAVDRNLMKRRGRALLFRVFKMLPGEKTLDVALYVKKDFDQTAEKQLKNALEKVLK